MAYPGRFIGPLPSSMEQSKQQEWLWRGSTLHRSRRTLAEAKQISSKQMVVMESLSPTALPSGVTGVHGAQKYAQIGCDAALQLLTSAVESWHWFGLGIQHLLGSTWYMQHTNICNMKQWLIHSMAINLSHHWVEIRLKRKLLIWNPQDGVPFTSSTGLVVIDCCPNVGHIFEGFVHMSQKINTPSIYIPLYSDMDHKEWSDAFWTSELITMFQKGDLNVPGCERLGPNC